MGAVLSGQFSKMVAQGFRSVQRAPLETVSTMHHLTMRSLPAQVACQIIAQTYARLRLC